MDYFITIESKFEKNTILKNQLQKIAHLINYSWYQNLAKKPAAFFVFFSLNKNYFNPRWPFDIFLELFCRGQHLNRSVLVEHWRFHVIWVIFVMKRANHTSLKGYYPDRGRFEWVEKLKKKYFLFLFSLFSPNLGVKFRKTRIMNGNKTRRS